MDRDAVLSLWESHKEERWPQVGSQHEGPLMTLDTVISGCVVYFLDSPEGLDAQRLGIVEDCVADLDNLTDELDDGCRPYFQRLRHLGAFLSIGPHSGREPVIVWCVGREDIDYRFWGLGHCALAVLLLHALGWIGRS